jgi:hypothetical protein
MMAGPTPVKDVWVTVDGVEHHGTYYLQGLMVHVHHSEKGWKATQVGGSPPKMIAKLLLSELVRS